MKEEKGGGHSDKDGRSRHSPSMSACGAGWSSEPPARPVCAAMLLGAFMAVEERGRGWREPHMRGRSLIGSLLRLAHGGVVACCSSHSFKGC